MNLESCMIHMFLTFILFVTTAVLFYLYRPHSRKFLFPLSFLRLVVGCVNFVTTHIVVLLCDKNSLSLSLIGCIISSVGENYGASGYFYIAMVLLFLGLNSCLFFLEFL